MLLKSAICENGHKLSTTLKPEEKHTAKFCPQCGGKVLDKCEYCNTFIPGGTLKIKKITSLVDRAYSYETESRYEATYPTPNFCISCGKPYPWTQKFLENYQLLLDLSSDEVDENLRKIILNSTQNLLKDNFSKNSIHILILKKAFAGLSEVTKAIFINSMVSFGGDAIKNLFK